MSIVVLTDSLYGRTMYGMPRKAIPPSPPCVPRLRSF